MNIFYASATKSSDSELTKLVEVAIPQYLKNSRHKVNYYKYDPGKHDGFNSFQEINKQITNSDVYIGEMSRASQSLGFQLSYALSLSKPCLYLYHEKRSGIPDKLITENPSRLLRIKTYNKNSYKRVLLKFISSAEKQLPSRRTSFMSTSQIDDFIGETAKDNGVSKGEAIRQVLDAAVKKKKDK